MIALEGVAAFNFIFWGPRAMEGPRGGCRGVLVALTVLNFEFTEGFDPTKKVLVSTGGLIH